MLTEQEKRDIRSLDDKIKKLAKEVWDEHPNNPNRKPGKHFD